MFRLAGEKTCGGRIRRSLEGSSECIEKEFEAHCRKDITDDKEKIRKGGISEFFWRSRT